MSCTEEAREQIRTRSPGPSASHAPARSGVTCYQHAAGLGWTSLPFLPLIRQPTLVLAGDDDPIIPLANAKILAALIPRARLQVYHGGHLELVTRPDLLAPVVAGSSAQPSPRQAPSVPRSSP